MNGIAKQQQIVEALNGFEDAFEQCRWLMHLGADWESSDSLKSDEHRLKGCQVTIWCLVKRVEGRIFVECDSDSLIIKGICRLLAEIYDGLKPSEIRACPLTFCDAVPDTVINPDIKRGGIHSCYEKILAAAAEKIE